MKKRRAPVHPGAILREEFMKPLGRTMNRLALELRVPVRRIGEIIHGRRGVSPETALRLARYFNTSAQFWLNLQSACDLTQAEERCGAAIEREVSRRASRALPPSRAAAARPARRRIA
jgi:addiction module HigA family antidote